MEKWKVHYTDENHDIKTEIVNHFSKENIVYSLCMQLGGILFQGMAFDDFEIIHTGDIETANREFSIFKWGETPKYHYELQRYKLEIKIPIKVIDIYSDKSLDALIHFTVEKTEDEEKNSNCRTMLDEKRVFPDKISCLFFHLIIGDDIFETEHPNLDFETSLLQICKKIEYKYLIKCCFGCLYSDYSPYGNNHFATMLCYLSVSDKYVQVSDKDSYWNVYDSGEQKQETFLCDGFKPRVNCLGGYRGSIY